MEVSEILKNQIKCDYCGKDAMLVTGHAVYPHRPDLAEIYIWECKPCDARVGCHRPNRRHGYTGYEPLGRLANAELRQAKSAAHAAFDPVWRSGKKSRKKAYAWLAKELGLDASECHIGEFDVDMCNKVEAVCFDI